MKKKVAGVDINLIPKDPFFNTILGKTLKWALSVGRYIVIFTELLVIVSFATRFSLDRQNTNLNDSINQKQAIINSYGDLEQNVRTVQATLEQYQQIQQQGNITEVFPALSKITPPDVKLEELIIRPTSVSLTGTTISQASLNLLINNIQLSGDFFNVSVDKIEANDSRTSNGYTFQLRADTQQGVVRSSARPAAAPTTNDEEPEL